MNRLDDSIKKIILGFQRNEITEYYIYRALAAFTRNGHNKNILKRLSDEELRHYHIWHRYSGRKVKPRIIKWWSYVALSAAFGVTFAIKLMERGEGDAQISYAKVSEVVPEAGDIQKEESEHENQLVNMINEEKLAYMGSMVLGLNDALVEFTGALAGFTFAFQNSRLIAMTGLIMGFSASLSMTASEYLSTKTETNKKDPFKASFYTGIAYLFTVTVLVLPYFLFQSCYFSLFSTLGLAVLLIAIFTFYSSVVKEISFGKRFREMFMISIGVACVSFLIGLAVKNFLNVDV